jgi:hypothetical protein
MKEISSAIIVLAGAVTLAAGGIWKSDTGNFAVLVGYGLILAGGIAWGLELFLDLLRRNPHQRTNRTAPTAFRAR